jgi:hypothetical protein
MTQAGDVAERSSTIELGVLAVGRMVRLPSPSTVPVRPSGTTTVVVGTSTTAGPVMTWPARRAA